MTTARDGGPRRPVAVVGAVVAVASAVAAVRIGLEAAGSPWAQVGLVVDAGAALLTGAVALVIMRRPRDPRSRLAWALLVAFPLAWLVAPAAWLVGATGVADAARGTAVLLAGTSWWFASRVGGSLSRLRPVVDGGIGAAAALVLAWDGPLSAAWAEAGGGAHGTVAVALPVAAAGTAVLGAAITVTEMTPGRRVRPTLFVGAMLVMAASDVAWALGLPPFWAAAWVVLAMAMRLEVGVTPRVVRVPTRGRLVYLPYALIVPSAIVLAVRAGTDRLSSAQIAGGLAIVGLLVARQHLSLLENDHLVARLEETERLLRHRAMHDSLTGLPGRAALHEHLTRLAGAHTPEARPLAVAFLDVDDFKRTNDRHGHAAGDAVLVEVAHRLLAALPHDAGAFASRLGGDEFAVVVTGPAAADADGLADRLAARVSGPVEVGATPVAIRVSVGAATVARGPFTPSSLLHAADLAMYAIKRSRPESEDDGSP